MSQRFGPGQAPVQSVAVPPGQTRYQPPPPQTAGMRPYPGPAAGFSVKVFILGYFFISLKSTILINI